MFPGYNIGTATLTAGSSVMTGQGTLWSGSVRPYDQVIGYDGSTALVGTVDSNTQITLLRPWRGAAQAAAAYDVLFSTDDVFAQALGRQVLQKISGSALMALADAVAAPRKLPYFDATSTAATTDLSDAARSLLALAGAADKMAYFTGVDTAALTSLTEFARSRLGDADAATMRTALGVAPHQVNELDTSAGAGLIVGAFGLGSVSPARFSGDVDTILVNGWRAVNSSASNLPAALQGVLRTDMWDNTSAGMQRFSPIGDFSAWRRYRVNDAWGAWRQEVERGSNSNGEYVRFSDGTQICTAVITTNLDFPATIGGGVRTGGQSWAYPAAFAATPRAYADALGLTAFGALIADTPGLSTLTYVLTNVVNDGVASRVVTLLAIGRWL